MRFLYPHFPAEFEIPDDWWLAAGLAGITLPGKAYRSIPDAKLIDLREIEPPSRWKERPLDFRGFDRNRMVKILAGLLADDIIDPVPLLKFPLLDWPLQGAFQYRVLDGMHRFHASVAAGFKFLPSLLS